MYLGSDLKQEGEACRRRLQPVAGADRRLGLIMMQLPLSRRAAG